MINKPNTDQAGSDSLVGALGEFLKSRLLDIDDMLPAIVISYDDNSNRAVLKPIVKMVDTSGNQISRASVANIPVFRFGGGGFFMRFPIKPGDFGWIKANDRDISLILQSGGNADIPNTQRIKSFSDAMFFPDSVKGWLIDGENQDAVVLQSLSGGVCLSIHDDKVVLVAPEFISKAPENIFEGNVTTKGNHSVEGESNSKGDIHTHGKITNQGKDIGASHSHSGVQPGGGNTGEVV